MLISCRLDLWVVIGSLSNIPLTMSAMLFDVCMHDLRIRFAVYIHKSTVVWTLLTVGVR